MKVHPGWLALLLTGSACAGPNLRGALAVDRGTEPTEREVASYAVQECRSATGEPLSSSVARVSRRRQHAERELLIEYRPRYSSVVIVNTYAAASERIFAYISDDSRRPQILHEYHLPLPEGAGQLLIFDRYELDKRGEDGFLRTAGSPIASCTLQPMPATF